MDWPGHAPVCALKQSVSGARSAPPGQTTVPVSGFDSDVREPLARAEVDVLDRTLVEMERLQWVLLSLSRWVRVEQLFGAGAAPKRFSVQLIRYGMSAEPGSTRGTWSRPG